MNSHYIPLITAITVLNEGTIISIALLYCPSEIVKLYKFFINLIKEFILIDSVPFPQVILTNRSSGIVSVIVSDLLLGV